jgi:integrase
LTVEELGQLIGAAKTPELKTLVALGIYTGMRLGDCCTLRCADVAGGMIVRTNRKTGKVTRIPVHHALAPMLQGRGEYLLPEFADLYLNHRMSVVEKMNDLFADAGIVTTSGEYSTGRARTVAGFHSLRHTFVSLCRTAGVPLAVVESLVGHTSAAMTRHYTHIGEAAAASAIALLPTVTGKSTVPRKKGGIQK